MPAGILILIARFFLIVPLPRHSLQVCLIFLPVPEQVAQVRVLTIRPNNVFCAYCTLPEPLHSGQVVYSVPFFAPVPRQSSHRSVRCIVMSLLVPKKASSNVKVMLIDISEGRLWGRWAESVPVNILIISSKKPPPEKLVENPPKLPKSKPPAAPGSAVPKRS